MDPDLRDSLSTAVFAAALLGAAGAITGGFSLQSIVNADNLINGGLAGAGEYVSEKIANMQFGAGSDNVRMVRTLSSGAAPAAYGWWMGRGSPQYFMAGAAGIAGHLASQYYNYGSVNM